MKERGMLYSTPMVRSLLREVDPKTQTRRPFYTLTKHFNTAIFDTRYAMPRLLPPVNHSWTISDLRHLNPGDRLVVRETWMPDPPRDGTWPHVAFDGCKPRDMSLIPERYRTPEHCLYRADGHDSLTGWTPAIHMFRWASRILLEVTEKRVERLQDISEEDAKAEGLVSRIGAGGHTNWGLLEWGDNPSLWNISPVQAYRALWEQINGPGSWDANPWVWAVSFKRVTP